MEEHTKQIDCPEHLNHKATLYVRPHRFSGVWECDVTGISDAHEHEDIEIDTVTTDYMTASGPDQYDSEIYVCLDCGEQVEGDPVADREEAKAEMQFEMSRE